MTALVFHLSDYRSADACVADIDLVTAVDVAVRDLREILLSWGSLEARQQLVQCEAMLTKAYCAFAVDVDQSKSR